MLFLNNNLLLKLFLMHILFIGPTQAFKWSFTSPAHIFSLVLIMASYSEHLGSFLLFGFHLLCTLDTVWYALRCTLESLVVIFSIIIILATYPVLQRHDLHGKHSNLFVDYYLYISSWALFVYRAIHFYTRRIYLHGLYWSITVTVALQLAFIYIRIGLIIGCSMVKIGFIYICIQTAYLYSSLNSFGSCFYFKVFSACNSLTLCTCKLMSLCSSIAIVLHCYFYSLYLSLNSFGSCFYSKAFSACNSTKSLIHYTCKRMSLVCSSMEVGLCCCFFSLTITSSLLYKWLLHLLGFSCNYIFLQLLSYLPAQFDSTLFHSIAPYQFSPSCYYSNSVVTIWLSLSLLKEWNSASPRHNRPRIIHNLPLHT
jgi:hypothetical protein